MESTDNSSIGNIKDDEEIAMTASGNIDWSGILRPDERLLWQGRALDGARPDLRVRFFNLLGTILSLGSLLFLVIAYLGRSQPDFVAGFGGLGVAMLVLGLGCRILPARLQRARLRRTEYALTNRRMLVRCGSDLQAFPITPDLTVEVLRRPPGSVLIAPPEDPRLPNRPVQEVGFIAIEDPDHVADLIARIQTRQTDRTETAT